MTDRLGSRPVFLCRTVHWLCIASDIRYLLALPFANTSLDLGALVQFVRFETILGDGTLYKTIKLLPAATTLGVDHESHTVSTKQYWTLRSLPRQAHPSMPLVFFHGRPWSTPIGLMLRGLDEIISKMHLTPDVTVLNGNK